VQYAGGHYEGPLALPMHPTEDQTDTQVSGDAPPPLPQGPWNEPNSPGGPPQEAPPPLPSPGPGPWGSASGPWGRH